MNLDLRRSAAATALVIVLATMAGDQEQMSPAPAISGGETAAGHSATDMIRHWPLKSRALADLMLDKYGIPDEMVSSQLSWNDRRPWTKVVVFRDHETAGRPNHLFEAVAYGPVTFDRWQDLTLFGRGAGYDPATHELSARTDGEATNFLALNLADEVIRSRRSAADARRFYDETRSLSLSGKSSLYMSGLLFHPRGRALPKLDGRGT